MTKSVECLNCGEGFDADDTNEGFWISRSDIEEVIEAVDAGEESDLIGELLTGDGFGVFGYRCDECGYVFGNGDQD